MRGPEILTRRAAEQITQSACAAMFTELARLRADLAEARADVQRFERALDTSQRELAQARAERVDALNRLGAGQVEYDSLYASLLDCQTERDEAEQITAAYAEEVAEAEDDLDRKRRTIRALVVAARAAAKIFRVMRDSEDPPVAIFDEWWFEVDSLLDRGQAGKE